MISRTHHRTTGRVGRVSVGARRRSSWRNVTALAVTREPLAIPVTLAWATTTATAQETSPDVPVGMVAQSALAIYSSMRVKLET